MVARGSGGGETLSDVARSNMGQGWLWAGQTIKRKREETMLVWRTEGARSSKYRGAWGFKTRQGKGKSCQKCLRQI